MNESQRGETPPLRAVDPHQRPTEPVAGTRTPRSPLSEFFSDDDAMYSLALITHMRCRCGGMNVCTGCVLRDLYRERMNAGVRRHD